MKDGTSRTYELICGLVLFEIGSTTLFLMGGDAKQDAWLAMTLGATLGFLLLLLYLAIWRRSPDRDLYGMLQHYLGNPAGKFIGILFVGYFIYGASRNARDLAEITILILLNQTPLAVILAITVLVVSNTTRYGREIFLLICVVLFPIVLFGYIFLTLLIAGSGLIHWEFILPVLENGWKPVWKAAFPEIVTFPFGETVLFLVFFPIIRNRESLGKSVTIAYWSVAFFLIFINQVNILVLGPVLANNSALPLLQTVQLIRFTNVFERMDPLFTMMLFLGLGIKIVGFLLGATTGMDRITGISYKKWVIPAGAAVFALSFLSPNYTQHLKVGLEIVVKYIHPVFQLVFPVALYAAMLLRKKRGA